VTAAVVAFGRTAVLARLAAARKSTRFFSHDARWERSGSRLRLRNLRQLAEVLAYLLSDLGHQTRGSDRRPLPVAAAPPEDLEFQPGSVERV
jgi:hypothetical protein